MASMGSKEGKRRGEIGLTPLGGEETNKDERQMKVSTIERSKRDCEPLRLAMSE